MRRAKLSAAALARLEHDVRNTYLTFRALGKKYGVSGQRVQQISQRWKIDTKKRWIDRREARHRAGEQRFESATILRRRRYSPSAQRELV